MRTSTIKTPLIHLGRWRLVLPLLLCLLAVPLSGCRKGPLLPMILGPASAENSQDAPVAEPPTDSAPDTPDAPAGASATDAFSAAYLAAIDDAKVAEPEEIVTTLTAITPYNANLIWEDGRVLMATWTDWDGYGQRQGSVMTLKKDVWVTASQEMRLKCLNWGMTGERLDMRLRQLLGLPPDAPYTQVAELWVLPDDLFRPSPDPEITDHEAELDYPGPQRAVRVATAHRRWMDQNEKTSYDEHGYPWTRLGYTYDWGNPDTEVGLSEFVIRKGAQVIVRSSWPTGDYCTQ